MCVENACAPDFKPKSISLINKERLRYNLPEITYDFDLHQELVRYTKSLGNKTQVYDSFYGDNPIRMRGYTLKGQFLTFGKNYYIFRDTFALKASVEKIMRHRINQRFCFNLSGCSNETMSLFQTCIKNGTVYKENRRPCSWAPMYYSMLMLKSLKSIACVSHNIEGRFKPVDMKQSNSFWCYGQYTRHNTTQFFKHDRFLEI